MTDVTQEQIEEDSNTIFAALTNGSFKNIEEAKKAVFFLYMPDMSFSRAGICHALKRLEAHYNNHV